MGNGLYLTSTVFKLLLFTSLVFISSCVRKADKPEAQKYLRAFDAELMQHSRRIARSDGMQALSRLLNLPSAPLPLIYSNTVDSSGNRGYSLEVACGSFSFDEQNQLWVENQAPQDSSKLQLMFQNTEGQWLCCRIYDYDEQPTALGLMFPTRLNATIMKQEHELVKVKVKSDIAYGFPASATAEITLAGYDFKMNLTTTFHNHKQATLQTDAWIKRDRKEVVAAVMKSDVKISEHNTLTYNEKHLRLEAFPLIMELRSAYDFSQSSANDFFNQWNRKSKVWLYSQDGVSLGELILKRPSGKDRLNIFIQYHDGTDENLEDLMLLVKSVLNVKIVPYRPH